MSASPPSGEKATLTTPGCAMRACVRGAPGTRTSIMSTPSLSVTASSAPSGDSGDTADEASKPAFAGASTGGGVAGNAPRAAGAAGVKRCRKTASFVRRTRSSDMV